VQQTVHIEPLGVELMLASGQTLLEAALAKGIAYPHNCTVGTCGSCKSLLKSGRVKAVTDFGYTLSRQELQAGYILACQAVALDERTVLELPDPLANLPEPKDFKARITNFELLTHDIAGVSLELDTPIEFVAGQYANVRAPGFSRARHYSFANAPKRGGRTDVTFYIRKVDGGAFTRALFERTFDGQVLEVNGPHGEFHLLRGNAPMICVAGGSGLAPIVSVLEDALFRRIRRPTLLLFGARTRNDLYRLERLSEIARSWPEPFEFIPILSQEPLDGGWTGRRGLVTDLIGSPDIDFPWTQSEGYLCGPPRMVDAGIDRLTSIGVGIEAIRYDKFTDTLS
jgi:p-cymene methyl-monooxygenase electron transfer component